MSGWVGGEVGWQDRKRKGGQLGGVLEEKMHGWVDRWMGSVDE